MTFSVSGAGRRTVVGIAGAVGVLAFAASSGTALADTPVKGGTLKVAIETDVRGFDAVEGGVLGQSGSIVSITMHEPLINYFPDGSNSPRLALSWEASDDLKSWTFKLREGVNFHDGTPFTATDVAHHYNRILDPKNKSRSRSFISSIQEAVVVEVVEDRPGGLVAQPEVFLQLRPAQLQVPIPEAVLLAGVDAAGDVQRKRLRTAEDPGLGDLHLQGAGGHLRVGILPLDDFPQDLHDPLPPHRSQSFGDLRGGLRVDRRLHEAGTVPQIQNHQPPQVPAAMDPGHEPYRLPQIRRRQRSPTSTSHRLSPWRASRYSSFNRL